MMLLGSTKPCGYLISITAQTMSNSPIERQSNRDNMTRRKGGTNEKEERSIDDKRVLDGWTVIFGEPQEQGPRFVYIDSAST